MLPSSFQLRLILLAGSLLLASCERYGLVEVGGQTRLDIRYATKQNFTGRPLYWEGRCFLRPETARKLNAVNEELRSEGLALKMWDCYRPLSVQRLMWEILPDERYVANPQQGSRHNRGSAVDVTLVRLSDGTELLMPTPYDEFSERAHRAYSGLAPELAQNRDRLDKIMTKHGFTGLATEWWHFDDTDWQRYPVIDVDLQTLRGPRRGFGT